MKKCFLGLILFAFTLNVNAQKVIQLYNGAAPGSENWNWNEAMLDSNSTPIVYNVTHPTLTVYLPDSACAKTNTAIIIAPGGNFHILAIKNEGTDVAGWLNKRYYCFCVEV